MRGRQAGFSLVELLVVMVVAGVMLAATYQTVFVQQRSYQQQMAISEGRQSTRTVTDFLSGELREMSASGGDLLLATPDSLRFRVLRKAGIACSATVGVGVTVWELGDAFAAGDDVLVFADGDPQSGRDDSWIIGRVGSISTGSCPSWNGLGTSSLGSATIAVNSVHPGALVRSYEVLTFGGYEIGGEWVLGRRADGGTVVSLLGPITPNGIRFRYFDKNGILLDPTDDATRRRVSRIEAMVRASAVGAPNLTGGDRERPDSLTVQINLRGNAAS